MSNTEQQIEQEIQDKGLNAPRLTPDHIDGVIASEHYFTAADGASNADNNYDPMVGAPSQLYLLTFCVLVLKNGFTVTGESACASPENFDAEIGRKIAYENARNKIWQLEGYLLKDQLHIKQVWRDAKCSSSDIDVVDYSFYIPISSDPIHEGDQQVGYCSAIKLGETTSPNETRYQIREDISLLASIVSNTCIDGATRLKANNRLLDLLEKL